MREAAPHIRVVDAAGALAADAAAIASGIPSRALMQRAGAAAAAEIATRYRDLIMHGVVVATGSGNNGGDGWVIARAMHDVGIRVRVVECAEAKSVDAIAERELAVDAGIVVGHGATATSNGGELIVIDALLGTGYQASMPLRDEMRAAIDEIIRMSTRGATIVAIDVPSALDASTGESATDLRCAMTVTFGTVKRGQLVARDRCGTIVVLDIGLGAQGHGTALASHRWFRDTLPSIPLNAHKGTRKKVAIVGGAQGMAGAVILAARAALRSGAGLVKCVVAPESVAAVQQAEPAALTAAWPTTSDDAQHDVGDWADAVLIGPGLGRAAAQGAVTQTLAAFKGPVVIDADALNAYEANVAALGQLLGERAALLTPHPLEFSRLSGLSVAEIERRRFTVGADVALACRATVLLKGVPTIVTSPSGDVMVVAEGTPILATGGAGDVLGGIAATLLAQTGDAFVAGSLAAYAHGRSASAVSAHQWRGFTLDDVLQALPFVWSAGAPTPRPPILAEF